jgi:hypothetical protein
MSLVERMRPSHPAHVSAEAQAPAPPQPAAVVDPSAPKQASPPMPERREAPKPQRFTKKAIAKLAATTAAERKLPDAAAVSTPPAPQVPAVVSPPARTEAEHVTPPGSPGMQPAPPPRQVTLNAGLLLPVRLAGGLSSERSLPGDAFHATLDGNLAVDGTVIAERGARVEGTVVASSPGDAVQPATLTVSLTKLYTNDGEIVAIQTDNFERHVGATGPRTIQLPTATRVTFRMKSPVRLTLRLRER